MRVSAFARGSLGRFGLMAIAVGLWAACGSPSPSERVIGTGSEVEGMTPAPAPAPAREMASPVKPGQPDAGPESTLR